MSKSIYIENMIEIRIVGRENTEDRSRDRYSILLRGFIMFETLSGSDIHIQRYRVVYFAIIIMIIMSGRASRHGKTF